MTILTLGFGPEASNDIIADVAKQSAVQRVSTQISLPGNGVAVPVLGTATAEWVERGDDKPVSDLSTALNVIQPYTVATIITVHKDIIEDHDAIVAAVAKEGSSALAKAFDNAVVFGPTPGSNFATFENADSVTVTDRASFFAAISAAEANGRAVDSIVISNVLLNQLDGAAYDTGISKFNIYRETKNSGTINGFPYSVFESTESIAVIGAFASGSRWGTVSGIEIDISNSATLVNGSTVTSLWQKNLVGIRVEARYGFQVVSEDDFVKFGTASGS